MSEEREELDYYLHSGTREIVCPWCGHTFTDSDDYEGECGEEECDYCTNDFTWSRYDPPFSYTTERKEP